MRPLRGLVLAAAAALLCATALAAADGPAPLSPTSRGVVKERIQGTRRDLAELKEQIRAGKKERKRYERQELSLENQLAQLTRELNTARREQHVHVQNLSLAQDQLRGLAARLDALQAEEAADRESLGRSLNSLYRARQSSGPSLLFSARTPAELAARTRYLEALSLATTRGVRRLEGDVDEAEGDRREVKEKEELYQRRKEDADSERLRVESEARRKLVVLRSVRGSRQKSAEAIRFLEQRAAGLQGLMETLQKESQRLARQARQEQRRLALQPHAGRAPRPSADGGPSTVHGGLPWPVAGRVVSRYGRQQHPIFHTPVFNRGIEIAAPFGSPVQAVAAGTVLHAGEMEGFGQLVVLDHGGGMMSVYGYGSQVHVAVGQSVEQGDLLEDVGEGLAHSESSLYFEIRQGAKAQDPLRYLRRRRS